MSHLSVPALEATICFGKGLVVSSFLISGRELRYGAESSSLLLGYAGNYLSRQLSRNTKNCGKKLKALYSKGFTGYQIKVKAPRSNGGATFAHTIGFDDLSIWVEHEASILQNPRAIALLTSAFREVLLERTQRAHGIDLHSIDVRQENFALSFDEREALLLEAREEIEGLWLPGDDELSSDCDWHTAEQLLSLYNSHAL